MYTHTKWDERARVISSLFHSSSFAFMCMCVRVFCLGGSYRSPISSAMRDPYWQRLFGYTPPFWNSFSFFRLNWPRQWQWPGVPIDSVNTEPKIHWEYRRSMGGVQHPSIHLSTHPPTHTTQLHNPSPRKKDTAEEDHTRTASSSSSSSSQEMEKERKGKPMSVHRLKFLLLLL